MSNQPPSKPTTQHPPTSKSADWVGQILDLPITDVWTDTLFLSLPDKKQVRLKLEDSRIWEERKPFSAYQQYAKGEQLRVFIMHHNGKGVYFAHERWAHDNPWPHMDEGWLCEGDVVCGRVGHNFVSTAYGTGVLVQLDTTQAVTDVQGASWVWDDDSDWAGQTVLQPDILVFIPPEEIPRLDAEDSLPDKTNTLAEHLPIGLGDTVQAMLLDTRQRPPIHPTASIVRLIAARDTADSAEDQLIEVPKTVKAIRKPDLDHAGIKSSEHLDSIQTALAGLQILVVEDRSELAQDIQNLLQSFGAHAEIITGESETYSTQGWLSMLVALCTKRAEQALPDFDMVLIDDGLPQPHMGEALAVLFRQWWDSHRPAQTCPRVWLTSNYTDQPRRSKENLLQLGLAGTLRRPLTLPRLKAAWEATKPIWEWDADQNPADAVDLRLAPVVHTAAPLLRHVCQSLRQDYAILLAVTPRGGLQWLEAEGDLPFAAHNLKDLPQATDLGQLIQGLVQALAIDTKSVKNLLNPAHYSRHVARWAVLRLSEADNAKTCLFGVGSYSGQDVEEQWPWLCYSARLQLQNTDLHTVLQRHASALSAGWLVQGHAHEQIGQSERLVNMATVGRGFIEQAQSGNLDVPLFNKWLSALENTVQAGQAMAERLLRNQRQSKRATDVQDWAYRIGRSLDKQCHDQGVALHWPEPPALWVLTPEWVLTVALSNLVFNAIKHHYRQFNRRIMVAFRLGQNCLYIDAADNGPGLNADTVATLFQPGISNARDSQQRHGIGLWLSKTLLHEAGADIYLKHSYRGLGTCFTLRIPIAVA